MSSSLETGINSAGADDRAPEPAFAASQSRKYPLDTEEHIRAAWTLIHDTANTAAYENSDRESIKERIRRAAAEKAIVLEGASPARQAKPEQEENPLDPLRRPDREVSGAFADGQQL